FAGIFPFLPNPSFFISIFLLGRHLLHFISIFMYMDLVWSWYGLDTEMIRVRQKCLYLCPKSTERRETQNRTPSHQGTGTSGAGGGETEYLLKYTQICTRPVQILHREKALVKEI
ncbi:MAG: hypothetical protein IJ494_05970, partial [Bacteroides sp.]|nr:hypothetical protein [Bacteroides sp.]